MKRTLTNLLLLGLLCFQPCFGQYSLREVYAGDDPEEVHCLGMELWKDGEKMECPDLLKPFMNCSANIAISGEVDGRYIAWVDFPAVSLYDLKTGKAVKLATFYEDSEGISGLQWEGDGDGDDTTEVVLINVNRNRYKSGCKIFHFSIYEGQLTKKETWEVNGAIKCGQKECRAPGFDFYDGNLSYETGNPRDQQIGMKIRKLWGMPGEGDEGLHIACVGYDNWWAMAEKYYFELLKGDGSSYPLPNQVKNALSLNPRACLSPTQRYLAYVDFPKVKVYDLQKQQDHELMTLYEDGEAFSELIWQEEGDRFAFVNYNPLRYPLEAKLFVLDIREGKLDKKQGIEIPAKDELRTFEFMDKNKIRFSGDGDRAKEWGCQEPYRGCEIEFE